MNETKHAPLNMYLNDNIFLKTEYNYIKFMKHFSEIICKEIINILRFLKIYKLYCHLNE